MQLLERDFPNVLYHFTSAYNALSILKANAFRLNAYFGTGYQDDDLDPKRFYYLSTTRTALGKYHRRAPSGVLIVIDRDKIQQNYAIRPMEYFRSRSGDRSEAEDRIVANAPRIENARKYIAEIHIGIAKEKDQYASKWDYLLLKVYFEAKKQGIPVYFYENMNDWQLLRKNRAVVPDVQGLYGRGRLERIETAKNRMPQFPREDWLAPWVELYYKTDEETLSDRSKKYLYNIRYGWFSEESIRKLMNEIHNQKRNPTPALHNLIKIFRKLGIRQPKQYIDFLKTKWKKDKN